MSSNNRTPESVLNAPTATVAVVSYQVGANRAARRHVRAKVGAPLLTVPKAFRRRTTNVPYMTERDGVL